jgi:hypothetical protein
MTGKGEWHEAVPLLRQAQDALNMAFGEEYKALGEAQYYLALAEVADSTEASLPSYDTELVQVSACSWACLSACTTYVTMALPRSDRLLLLCMLGVTFSSYSLSVTKHYPRLLC